MNKKAFQQQTDSQVEIFPTHTADHDTGEKSRRGDPDTDTNLDSDGNTCILDYIIVIVIFQVICRSYMVKIYKNCQILIIAL